MKTISIVQKLDHIKLSSEFWKLEVERVEGEAVLFLGPKSKHTQFGKMCLDPRNEKFKVEKEEDLQVNANVTKKDPTLSSTHEFF